VAELGLPFEKDSNGFSTYPDSGKNEIIGRHWKSRSHSAVVFIRMGCRLGLTDKGRLTSFVNNGQLKRQHIQEIQEQGVLTYIPTRNKSVQFW